MVFSLWPDPISISSVLFIFRVSLLAFNQVCTFNRLPTLPTFNAIYIIICVCAYHRRTSSVRSVTNNLEGHLCVIRIRVDRGWSLAGHHRSVHGCQIRTHQLSIVTYGSPNTIETVLISSQTCHKSQA